jgi:signal peptidase II
MNFYKKITLLLLILIAGSFVDHLTKYIAKKDLSSGRTYSFLFDTFRLQYSENTGAFLSMGENLPPTVGLVVLTLLPAFFLIILFVYIIFSTKITAGQATAFSLILTGGVNNIYDRIFNNRHVIDFMNWGIGPYIRLTGIINFADMYVTAGFIIIIILVFMDRRNKAS